MTPPVEPQTGSASTGWRWTQLLVKGPFVRSVFVLMSGTVAGQALTVLASPLITRLYTPSDYGIMAVLASVASVLLVAASLRYEIAIPVARKGIEAAQLLALSLLLVLLVSVTVALTIAATGGIISAAIRLPAARPFLWYLPLAVLTAGVYNALRYSALRSGEFKQIARSRIWQGGGGVSVRIGLGIVTAGPLGLLLGAVVAQAAGVGSLARIAWREHRRVLRKLSFRRLVSTAMRWRRFPLVACPSALLNSAGLQITPIILASLYGAETVGWFSLSLRVIAAPVLVLAEALAQVYFSEAATRARSSPLELQRLFTRVARRLVLVAAVFVPIVAVSAPVVFAVVFGDEWREAGEYLRVLAPMIFAQLVVSPLSQTIFIIDRQDLQLIWDLARLGLVATVFVAASVLDMTAMAAITAYSGAMFVAYVAAFFMYRYALRQYLLGAQL